MKKIINKTVVLSLMLSAGVAGCNKQLDINNNPNQPGDDVIKAENILPNALHATGSVTALGYGWLSNWMGYWSASGSFNPSTEESSYNVTNTFQEGKWTGTYNVLFDLEQVEQKAKAAGETFYQAAAMITKAHLFQFLVDIYGNVPYTQAFKPTEFPTPAYDDAQAIYTDLQAKLDEAITLMQGATVSTKATEIDVLNAGSKELWIKMANTIKLRLLIRATQVNNNPTAELAKIKANGGVLQTTQSADINIGYLNDVSKQSPFYATYGLLPSGEDANTFYRANQYSIESLKSNQDPRLRYFFKPAKSPTNAADSFIGTVYGSEPNSSFGGDQTSNIGQGLVRVFNQPQWVITSIESLFLQAEAQLRGWDVGSPYADAAASYAGAVQESFIWLGVPDAVNAANNYMLVRANWANAADFTAQLTLLIRQKYVALTGINPQEAWNDYRRLGLPNNIPLSINTARGSRNIPVRLSYPSSEYAVNAKSVQTQGTINTQTSTIFWDK
ncbi:MAG: SusD/RagB family nutrient-binding outer membrane lipoprotein [Candidatus Pseudobacter hemicellulosilyticus]|uniref:SusD/RagB family nutrient-binding outer membrane lipoprotein n=1 Tax=Candidatus Pseudobacter hemicellulosilyticus TaxID=3121375 RepID=A0AAJ6BFM1_9BACT|nr:MAG: SusD/RagB family nutrient-binding outer membrane lipoprotein [Pseudobacter sp.]